MSVVSSAEKIKRLGDVDPAGADLPPVVVQGDGAALGETAAVVGELGPHLVGAGGEVLGGVDAEFLHAEEVVDEPRPVLFEVERPAAEPAALRDDHPVRRPVVGGGQRRRSR